MLAITHIFSELLPVVEQCLFNFRVCCPDAELVVIGDGVAGDYPDVVKSFGGEWLGGELLKRTYTRPLWTERLFRVAMHRPHDFTLLFDPDTRFWRPLRISPQAADCNGQVLPSLGGTIPTVNGCCSLYRRALVARVLPVLQDGRVWNDVHPAYKQYMKMTQRYMHDQWMPFILRRVNGTIAETGEVGATVGGEAPLNIGLVYAVTHPHKDIGDWK